MAIKNTEIQPEQIDCWAIEPWSLPIQTNVRLEERFDSSPCNLDHCAEFFSNDTDTCNGYISHFSLAIQYLGANTRYDAVFPITNTKYLTPDIRGRFTNKQIHLQLCVLHELTVYSRYSLSEPQIWNTRLSELPNIWLNMITVWISIMWLSKDHWKIVCYLAESFHLNRIFTYQSNLLALAPVTTATVRISDKICTVQLFSLISIASAISDTNTNTCDVLSNLKI